MITLSPHRTGNPNLTVNHLNLYFGVAHQSPNTHEPSPQAVQCVFQALRAAAAHKNKQKAAVLAA